MGGMTMLGKGMYALPEAARLLRTPSVTLRHWFSGTGADRGHILRSDYHRTEGRYVLSFLDLIDALTVLTLREMGFSLQLLRRAAQVLRREIHPSHPFAHSRLARLGRQLLLETADELGAAELREVLSRQEVFAKGLEPVLRHVDYEGIQNLASRWAIREGIVIDPSVCFGKPVVQGTGVATYVLARSFDANEGDAAVVAAFYGVSAQQVERAVEFEISLAAA